MPPANQQKCEQCHRKPKYLDPATGQLHPYCGRTCAATAKANAKGSSAPSNAPSSRSGGDSSASSRQTAKLLKTVGEELSKAKKSTGNGIDTDLINRFKRKNTWQFSDVKGTGDVTMSREFNGENITIAFSLNKTEPFDDFADADSDEEDDENDGDGSDDNGSGSDSSDDEDEDEDLVLSCTISISKPGKGVMIINSDAVDGEFEILNFSFTQDTKLAVVKSAEQEFISDSLYVSPEFYELGEQFQEQFVEYLALRGIDSDLARFIQEYSKNKEQVEEINFLERMQAFLS